jgi:hypothetical protein
VPGGTVTVPAGGSTSFDVTLSLSAAAVAALPPAIASNFGALQNVRGAIVATPTTSGAGIYALRVPFELVPRGLSNVTAGQKAKDKPSGGGPNFGTSVALTNSGIHAGTADLYAWGISDADDVTGAEDSMDVRAVGVQSLPGEVLEGASSDRTLVFAVNTYGRWSNPATNELDVAIDSNRDGNADYFVIGVDFGVATTGTYDGRFASLIFTADDGELVNAWVADAPMNGSTALLPTLASDIGVTSANSSFAYSVGAFSIVPGGLVDTTGAAGFDAFTPALSIGDGLALAPGETKTLSLSYDRSAVARAKALGWMIVTLDDPNGAPQADLVPIGTPGKP